MQRMALHTPSQERKEKHPYPARQWGTKSIWQTLVFCLVVNYASGTYTTSRRQYLQDKTMKVLKTSLPHLNSSLVLLKPQLLFLLGRYEGN